MTIQNLKRQIEAIEGELKKDYTQYSEVFLKNRLITLKDILHRKQKVLMGV